MTITAAGLRQAMVDKDIVAPLTQTEIDRMISEIDAKLACIRDGTACKENCVVYSPRKFQRDDPNKGKLWSAVDCQVAEVQASLQQRGFTVEFVPLDIDVFTATSSVIGELYYITWPET